MNSKAQAILSYLGILWLIAYFCGKKERDHFSIYHLKQGLGLLVLAIIFNVAVRLIAMAAPSVALMISYAGILFLILMVIGIIHAVNEVKKPLPIFGKMFEDKFPFIDQ
ncbi:hypothetical protein H8S90_14105 [Olivibacter sp. SDN3]|uniref:hypothetical protein n=1 Tax=Olivibacter sp. SDN3 TaxID=2764720 RepID=UPI001651100C|nr:hypothetical protein [Olivibacter sp. SDN3]QNL47949.1 hypothetical protein H8S90_14105 [Olivibacter sp. SDN3]